MNFIRTDSSIGSTILLEGELTIYHVTELKTSLLSNNELIVDPLSIDIQGVTELDTAGIQLLVFLQKTLCESNKRVFISKSNEYVDESLNLLSLKSSFSLGM